MVIAYGSPVTSISYRSWMSLEICEDPVLLVNVAINLLCLYRSVWMLFYLNIFEYVFVPRAQRRLTPEWITFLGKIIYIFLGSGFVCISPCLNSLLTFNSKQKRQISQILTMQYTIRGSVLVWSKIWQTTSTAWRTLDDKGVAEFTLK